MLFSQCLVLAVLALLTLVLVVVMERVRQRRGHKMVWSEDAQAFEPDGWE